MVTDVFSSKLLELRQQNKMTQEDLANIIGVTPQAISKWERGNGLPDVELICEISKVLDTSLNSLLGIHTNTISESNNYKDKTVVMDSILSEPVTFLFGSSFTDFLVKENESEFKRINDIRVILAKEFGYLLPTIRIKDSMTIEENQYQILIYDKIVMDKYVDDLNSFDYSMIYDDIKKVSIENYKDILNRQIVQNLVDNVSLQYPALIDGIIPNKITLSTLQAILRIIIENQKSIRNLVKIIEMIEDKLDEGNDITTIGYNISNII